MIVMMQTVLVVRCQLLSTAIDMDLLVRNQKKLFSDEDHHIVPNKIFSHEDTRWLKFR